MIRATVLRRAAVLLSVLAGVGVVALAWMVPEPPATDSAPQQQSIEPISYERCVQQAPPSYGTRSLTNTVVAAGC